MADALDQDGLCTGGLEAAFLSEEAEVNKFQRWGNRECHS